MDEDVKKALFEMVGRWQSAYFLSKAILQDYSDVISKISGDSTEDIKERINKEANRLMTEFKATQKPL